MISLGHNVSLDGLQGTGKSTSASAFVEYYVSYLKSEINHRMDILKLKLYEINFVNLDEMINEYFKQNDNKSIIHLTKFSDFSFVDEVVDEFQLVDRYYVDFLHIENKLELLYTYIILYYILNIRGILVLSKTRLYVRSLKSNAYVFDESSVEISNVLRKNNFQLSLGCVILEDERNLTNGNVYSNDSKQKKSGSKIVYSLIRNMGQGLIFRLTLRQRSDDDEKQARMLVENNMLIVDRKDNITYFRLIKFLSLFPLKFFRSIVKITYFIMYLILFIPNLFKEDKKYSSFFDYLDHKSSMKSLYRLVNRQIFKLTNLYASTNYIRLKVLVYRKCEDVGKMSKDLFKKMKFYFPCKLAYKIDTFEYKDLLFFLEHSYSKDSINEKTSAYNLNAMKNLIFEIDRKSGDRIE